jgi:hypothetical protein
MAVIHLRQLSIVQAERCMAEIWTCLEEYDIPSPEMSFEFRDALRTDIRMRIEDPVSADTLATRLSGWAGTVSGCLDDGGLDPGVRTHTQARITFSGRAAAPLAFALAAAPPPRSSHHVSRPKRK